jgi:thioredoxin-like negative regulator of GroEL
MTPEQHRDMAERLIDAANQRMAGNEAEWLQTPLRRGELRAQAQIHATLALAASDERVAGLEERIRKLEEADETDGLADRIEAIERAAGAP